MTLGPKRHWLSGALAFAALGLVALSFHDVDPSRLGRLLAASSGLLWLTLLPQLASISLETWAWGRALASVQSPVRYADLWVIRTATEAIYQLVPGGPVLSDSLKPVLLRARAGLSISVGIGAALYRKYLRLLGQGPYVFLAVTLGMPAVVALSDAWFGSRLLVGVLMAAAALLVVLATAMGTLLGRSSLALGLLEVLGRFPVPALERRLALLRQSCEGVDQATRAFFRLPARAVFFPALASGVAWTCEAIEAWLILHVLGVHVPFELILGVDVAISLGRQLMFWVPAGIGVQEAGYLAALVALGVPAPVETAAAFCLVKRGKELVWGALGLSLVGGAFTRVLPSRASLVPAR